MQLLPVDPKTISQFSFSEGTGTTSVDTTGRYTATLHSCTWGTEGDTPSGIGRAIVFDGAASYVTIAGLLASTDRYRELSISFKFKGGIAYPTASTDARLFSIFGGTFDFLDVLIRGISNGGILWVRGSNGSTGTFDIQSAQVSALGTANWHQLTVVFSLFGIGRIYLDGVKIAELTNLATLIPAYRGGGAFPFTLGALNSNGTPGSFFTGKIAELTVEERAWSTPEDLASYTTGTRYPTVASKLLYGIRQLGGGSGDGPSGSKAEVSVIAIPGGYRHFESRGWTVEGVYTGTSTDGLTVASWTKILGSGTGSESGTSCGRSSAFRDPSDSSIYLFYVPTITAGAWRYIRSTDNGATWSAPVTTNIAYNTITNSNGAANSSVIKDSDGLYKALLEYYDSGTSTWKMVALSATSPSGTWTILNSGASLTTLGYGGSYGGPMLFKVGTTYYLFYHASISGVLPTATFMASSTDLITWTKLNESIPVIPLDANTSTSFDQSADPSVLFQASRVITYWSRNINASQHCSVSAAVYQGTAAQLVAAGSSSGADEPVSSRHFGRFHGNMRFPRWR